MKIAVLWTHFSGYLSACLRALAERPGIELFVSFQSNSKEAPYADSTSSWISRRYIYDETPGYRLIELLQEFQPDVMLVTSWHVNRYRAACRQFSHALRVCCMDNQWRGTAKQRFGALVWPWALEPLYDAMFLPGEPQVSFARRLGFAPHRVWRGLYCADHPEFAAVYQRGICTRLPKSFLFTGRLSAEKGVTTLAAAYRAYRKQEEAPWPLTVVGTGPLQSTLADIPGVALCGFVQPKLLPHLFANAGCLVLPSLFEPWGVVIHEGAAAGLPIICTSACGAAVHLVNDRSGFVVPAGNVEELALALSRFTHLADDTRQAMSAASFDLSLQYTPVRWADYVYTRTSEMLNKARRPLAGC